MNTSRRRHFLASGLTSLLLSPFVRTIRRGLAQTVPGSGRAFVAFYYPHTIKKYFFASRGATESDFTFPAALAPLQELRENVVLFGSMTMRSGTVPRGYDNHAGSMHILTAYATLDTGPLGPSVDQVIADRIGSGTPRKSVNLWTQVDPPAFGLTGVSYRGPKQKVTNESSPHAAFKGLMIGNGAMSSAEFDAVTKTRRSVLDNMTAELGGLEMRLAGEERRMMDAHLEAVRSVEKALFSGAKAGSACKGDAAALGPELDFKSPANYAKLVKLHTDVLVMALACDITRVGVLQMGNDHNEQVTFPWLNINKTHHLGIQHNGTTPEWTDVTRWFTQQFVYLMKSLKAIPTPTGNLLTDSVLLSCNNMGNGHSIYDMGFVLAGNAGGRIKGGRLINTETGDPDKNQRYMSHAQLLLSICHAMGLNDLQSFGQPGKEFCPGPIPGLVT
jgi:hypothetical protein